MAEIRFNYGDKFTQTTDTNTGIGSTIPAAKLDIAGGTSVGSLRVSGIATLSSYQGFVNTKLTSTENIIVEAGQSGSVSGEVVVSTGQTISVSTGATTGQGGIQSLKVYKTFMPPVGGTADRPTDVKPGMVYYNKDFKTIEFWDGNFWKQVDNTIRRGRAVIAGGYTYIPSGGTLSNIESLQISTFGNSISFGEITSGATNALSAMSSSTRMLLVKGDGTTIEYVTIASEGNPIDFGDTHTLMYRTGGEGASSTRGLILGGRGAPGNGIVNIQYIEMGTLGNMLDFGDLNTNGRGQGSGGASPIRAFATSFTSYGSKVEMVTIASTGNATNFGNLTFNGGYNGGCSNNRILILGGGYSGASPNDIRADICKYDMTSGGQAVTFGEFQTQRGYAGSTSNSTRGVYCGGFIGNPGSGLTNTTEIESVEFASDGGTTFFGDLGQTGYDQACSSDSHGGLGGF